MKKNDVAYLLAITVYAQFKLKSILFKFYPRSKHLFFKNTNRISNLLIFFYISKMSFPIYLTQYNNGKLFPNIPTNETKMKSNNVLGCRLQHRVYWLGRNPGKSIVLFTVLHVDSGEGASWITIQRQGADRQQQFDSGKNRRPAVFQDIQADVTLRPDVIK